jgi:hypothetical protein
MAIPVSVQSAMPTAKEDFRSGVSAFQEGDFDQAKLFLERAREAGLESPSLLYNLGVVYYRLEQFQLAETAFSELLDTPHAPLARYNLGLVLLEKGDDEGARAWFTRAAGDDSPDQVRQLARQQLNALSGDAGTVSPTGSAADEGSARVAGYLSMAAGFDSNIATTPSGASSEEEGAFADLLASGGAYFDRSGGNAVRLDAVAYTRQYPGNAESDNAWFAAGAAWQQALEGARLVSGVTVSGFWYGADLLEQKVQLDTTYERPGCFQPGSQTIDCQFRVFAATIQGGPDFSAYDGEAYGAEISLEKTVGSWSFEPSYRLDVDRRSDLESDTEFVSLSPTRHRFSISVERALTSRLDLGASQSFRLSRYDDPHRLITNGDIRVDTREDEQSRTLIFGSYKLDQRWWLGLEAGWVQNQSNLDRYEYDRSELMVSLDGVF